MAKWQCFLTVFVVRLICLYSLAIGITAIHVNLLRKKVIKSRLISVYATCMNVAFIVSMPLAMYVAFVCTNNLMNNKLLYYINLAAITIYLVICALMIIFRRSRDLRMETLVHELLALDRQYFDRLPFIVDIEKRFARVLFAKAFTTFGQIVANVFGMLVIAPALDVPSLLRIIYTTNMKFILHSVMFHYFSGLWHTCKRFEILNIQTKKLVQEMQVMATYNGRREFHYSDYTSRHFYRKANRELSKIALIHLRLTHLVQNLCNNYILQTMAVISVYAITTIIFGYISMLIWNGFIRTHRTKFMLPISIFSYTSLLFDLYLFYWICEATVNAYKRTRELLKQIQFLPMGNKDFEDNSERFSLQLMQRRFSISMAGMFNLNLQTLLALWAFILRHTIILIQFDLENRLRHQRHINQ